MQEQEKPTTEIVSLPAGGSVPGIPGSHGPGAYLINRLERTITPIVAAVETEIARIEEAIHPVADPAQPEPGAVPVEVQPAGEQDSQEP